jgi:hypothetical protein
MFLGATGVCKAAPDVLFGNYHHTTNEMVRLAVAAGSMSTAFSEVMTAKGSVAGRGRRRARGYPAATNPQAAMGGFASWLWPIAEVFGAEVTTSRETAARSMVLLEEKLRAAPELRRR